MGITRFAAGLMAAMAMIAAMAPTQGVAKLPDFAVVEQQTKAHFKAIKDLQAGDLISRDQVEELFEVLARFGWQVADRDEILAQVLSESDPLVKRLRTKAGKKFMRQAAGYPQAYDRLDHLERLSDGRRILDRLIEGPDGYKLIEYLTTSSGGKNMGKMLSEAPGGDKFNKATGRIYTQEQLLDRLKESYTKAQQGSGKPAGQRTGSRSK
jgi:hypothetical protein